MPLIRVLMVVLVLTFGLSLAAQATPVGGEFQVNTVTTNQQRTPSSGGCVARDDAGNFVVVWASTGQDSGSTTGVYGQRYSSTGAPIGIEFLVNVTVLQNQQTPAVAMNGSGAFVVAWQSSHGTGNDVYFRRYDSAGAPIGGEIQANTYVDQGQQAPAVALDDAGNFVVVWESANAQDGSGLGIFGQRYSPAGAPIGAEFQVNTTTSSDQRVPAVAVDAAGNFVVVWQSFDQDSAGTSGIYGQRYTAAGATVGTEFLVNTNTAGDQSLPAIAMEDNGDFVVAFQSSTIDGNGLGVVFRRFTAAGAPIGAEAQANTFLTGDQDTPSAAMDADGDFVIAWNSAGQDTDGKGVYAQLYTNTGAAAVAEFLANTFVTSDQGDSSVAMDMDGDFVVVWQSFAQDSDLYGVYAQRYTLSGPPAPITIYVDAAFTGTTPGTDPDGPGPATSFGTDSFDTLPAAIAAATPGSTLMLAAGI